MPARNSKIARRPRLQTTTPESRVGGIFIKLHFHVGTPISFSGEQKSRAKQSQRSSRLSFVKLVMRAHELVLVALGSPGVAGFFVSPANVLSTNPGCCHGSTRMAALDFSASPVNSAETLKRTTDLSLAGAGAKKKLALLGSTVRPRKGDSYVSQHGLVRTLAHNVTHEL